MIEVSTEYPQDLIRGFVGERIGVDPDLLMPSVAAAVLKYGNLIGGVVFHNYHELPKGSICEVSVAFDEPFWTRKGMRTIFNYPFKQLRVSRLQAATYVGNIHCRSILERLGFQFEGIMRKAYDGETDSCLYSMMPGECRWIGGQ